MMRVLLTVILAWLALASQTIAQYPEVSIRQIQEVPMDSLLILDTCRTGCPSWSVLRSRYEGDTVTIVGLSVVGPRIITYTRGGFTMLLYDTANTERWRGLFVRSSADTSQHALDGFLNVHRGDIVKMTGLVTEFPSGYPFTGTEFQPIAGIPISIIGTQQQPPPVHLEVGNFRSGDFSAGRIRFSTAEPYEGMIVELANPWASGRVNSARGTFSFVDSRGNQMADYDASRFFTLGHGGIQGDSIWRLMYPSYGTPIDTLRGFIMKSPGGSETQLGYRIAPVFRGDVLISSTSVEDLKSVPVQYSLYQNCPNPFNPVTNFQFSISNSQLTILKVFDILGREVATLVNEVKSPGTYTVQWDGSGFATGVFFSRLEAGGFVQTKKIMMLR